jgi:nitroreductase
MIQLSPDELLSTTRAVRRRLDLTRPVEDGVLGECFALAQQAPSASNRQQFHFIVVRDRDRRARLADLFRRGLDAYKEWEDGLYRLRSGIPEEDRRRDRIIASLEHLGRHMHEVPVHVVPCVEGVLEGQGLARIAALSGSVMPATWSFMLAARSRGLGTCWSTLHLQFPEEADAILEVPEGVTQVALVATAYSLGTTFKAASRRPLDEIIHWENW